jgi:hypothetical protein
VVLIPLQKHFLEMLSWVFVDVWGIVERAKCRVGDYRTIDWVHDSVKDQFRKKKLRAIPGIRGVIVNTLDALEGWVLVAIIGMSFQMCGCG